MTTKPMRITVRLPNFVASLGTSGREQHEPDGRRQRGQPGLERAQAEGGRVLEEEAHDEHQPVDRPGADEDAERRADQQGVPQQGQVDEGRRRSLLRRDEAEH